MSQSLDLSHPGELASFFPMGLGGLVWSSGESTLSGNLSESLAFGFLICLQVSLSDSKGEAFLEALIGNRMEEPVVEMVGDVEVVDAEFECRG